MSRQTGYQDTYGRNQDLAFRPNRKGGPGGGYNPGGSGGGGGGRGGQTCHTCGELGHISRNCPKGTSGGGPSTERRNPHGPPSNNVEGGRAPTTALAISAETKTETQKENTLVRSFISKPRTAKRNPYRPSYGTKGTLVEFQTNYFPVNLPPELLLHRYKINIDAIVDEKGKELPKPRNKKLKQIIKILLPILASRDSKICIATDFQSTLICSGEIPQNRRNQEIKYFNENDSEPGKDAQKYKLHIEEIKPPLEVSELQKLLASTEDTVEYEHRDSIVQALNILFGHYAKSSPTTTIVGGNRVYTDDAQRSPLNGGLEAIRGYFLSVRLASFRILVNVNVSHGAFYETVSLRDLIDSWSKKNALRTENDWFRLQTFLKGVKVKTNYLEDERRNQITKVRSIKGFASQRDGAGKDFPPFVEILAAPPQQVWFYCDDKRDFRKQKDKLKDEEGNVKHKYISVEEFFKSNHNVESDRDGRYPVINYGSRQDPMYVPTEACFVERGQLGKLTPEQTEAMISFAVRSPSQNVKSIKDAGLPALGLFPISSEMKRLSLNVSPKMITVCGRMLSVPSVLYKGNAIATSSSGGWNLRNVQFKISLPKATDNTLKNWVCLRLQNYSDKHQQGIHESAISEFRNILRNCGIGTENPVEQTLIFDKKKECFCDEKGRSLEQWIAISRWKQKIDIILVILPIKDTALYNQIKRLFDRAEGIHTVCVTVKDNRGKGKFYSRNGTYLANVALKFNLKLGGTNHTLGDIEMGIISQGKTMVVGIDVIHPSPGSEKASVASMVASINKDLAQWPVDLRVQLRKGQEMLDGIYEMLTSRLLLWKTHHGVYPENILVYRDGVSESQYEQVLRDELVDMQRAGQDLYDTVSQPLPRITLIIVGKRHHTRFYPPNHHPSGDKNGNPQRGLVVDRGITEARKWDFFLQSHNAIQGTARPAHYIVLWDEIFTNHKLESVHQAVQPNVQPVDRLERVTHSMCYLFSRATKAVSIPAPVYYADIACERAKRYIVESSADTESGITDAKDMTDGQRERLRFDLQRQIDLHIDLKDSMFYI